MQVAIVGSGPAGLMAAEVLARAGAAVTVFEQHRSPGRKFLLAGRSGLNLTHAEPLEALLERYGPDRPWLESAIRGFDAEAVQTWCAGLGEEPYVGTSGRVFPASTRATPLLRSWLGRLDVLGVQLRLRHRWTGWEGEALNFVTPDGDVTVRPDTTLLACGGPSWPRVGGDGSWQRLVDGAGIATSAFVAANCGVRRSWSDIMLERYEGDPIKNIAVRADAGTWRRGDVVVTKDGLEGGPIYALSRELRAMAEPVIEFDLLPDLSVDAVLDRLAKRRKKDTQTARLRGVGLSDVMISLVRDATGNQVPAVLSELSVLLKALPVPIDGLAELDRAISSSGGVRFDQLDEHFMVKGRPGVFVAGEMLDWEAPTGGYLLQACLSTGVAAAEGVLRWMHDREQTSGS